MQTITRSDLIVEMAKLHKISKPKAALTVTLVCAELELTETAFSLRTAGEIEAIVARKIKAVAK